MKLGSVEVEGNHHYHGEESHEEKDVKGDVFSVDDNDWWGMVKVNVNTETAKCIEGRVPRGKGSSRLNEEHDFSEEDELKIKYSRKTGPHWDYVQYYVCGPVGVMDDVLERLDGLTLKAEVEDEIFDHEEQERVEKVAHWFEFEWSIEEKDFSKVEKEEMAGVIAG